MLCVLWASVEHHGGMSCVLFHVNTHLIRLNMCNSVSETRCLGKVGVLKGCQMSDLGKIWPI